MTCFTSLEHVVLKGASGADLSPLQHAPLLKHLKIDGALKDMTPLVLFTALADLDLIGLSVWKDSTYRDQELKVVATLTRLERLLCPCCEIDSVYDNWDSCISVLGALSALTDLNVRWVRVSHVGIRHLAAFPRPRKCALLLGGPAMIDNIKVWRVVGAMTNLVALELREAAIMAV